MKKCNMCGGQFNDSITVCPNCGNPNLIMDTPNQPMANQPMPSQPMGGMQQPPMPSQPMGGMQQPPMPSQPMGGMQQPPMPNQPMANQMMPNQPMMGAMPGNMPMTYATVYMVLLIIGAVSNVASLVSEFSVGTLFSIAFGVITAYFLYKRSKIGRILVMISNIFTAIVGGLVALIGVLFMVGLSVSLGSDFAGLGAAFGFIFVIIGAIFLVFGICSFIYFKKRASMYIN